MVVVFSLALSAGLAVGVPTPEQVKEVFDHYWNGQGKGAVLADAVLCKTIEQKNKKDAKYLECVEPTGDTAAKGDTVHVHVTFLVPNGDKVDSINVQALCDGQVRETKDLSLKGDSIRTRTWVSFKLAKPGKWEFKIQDGDKTVKTLAVTAS